MRRERQPLNSSLSGLSLFVLLFFMIFVGCDSEESSQRDMLFSDGDMDVEPQDMMAVGGVEVDAETVIDLSFVDMNGPTDQGLMDLAVPDLEVIDMEPPPPACANGLDDDEDGATDYPRDVGCSSEEDDDEVDPDLFECEDELDNDEDGLVDLDDPSCGSPLDPSERSVCGPHEAFDISYRRQIIVDSEGQPVAFEACRSNDAPEQVFVFTLRQPVEYLYLSTEGSAFDTLLSVRRDCDDPSSEVACNDDVTGAGGPTSSAIQLDSPALGEYYVIVDGYGQSSGRVVLSIEAGLSEGDPCPVDEGPFVCPRGQACNEEGVCAPAVCSDQEDNDGDERADYPADPGCESPEDQDETDPMPVPECGDGEDNDRDGLTDFPNDPECDASSDNREGRSPVCDDRIDNDRDGLVDFPNDPGCRDPEDSSEYNPPACNDSLDNDEDGLIDYPADPGCAREDDESERDPRDAPQCADGVDNDEDGLTDYPEDALSCRSASDGTEDDPCQRRIFRDITGQTSARGNHNNETNDFGGSCGGDEEAESLLVWRVSADRPLASLNLTTRNSEAILALYVRDRCEDLNEIACTTTSSPLEVGPRAAGEDVYIFVDSRFFPGIWRVQFDAKLAEGARCDPEGIPGERWQCGSGLICLEEFAGFSRCIRPQCNDQQDNDGDGAIDYPNDPGCLSSDDHSEVTPDPLPACANDVDEDRDGLFDFGEDPDCQSAADDFEGPACRDGIDNDEDGRTDFSADGFGDLNCQCENDPTEDISEPACSDGCDNDGDGLIDGNDPGCQGPQDNNEFNELACRDLIDNDEDGLTDFPNDPGCEQPSDPDENDPDPLPACGDGVDNDGDGRTDFGEDDGCQSAADDEEEGICDLSPLSVDESGIGSGDTSMASGSQVGSCAFGNAPEVLYYFEPPHPVDLTISTLGSQFNTVLYARSTCQAQTQCLPDDQECTPQATELACSQDTATGTESELQLSAVSDPLYLFVDGFGTQSGAYQLSISGQYLAGGRCTLTGPTFLTCPDLHRCLIDEGDGELRCLPDP